MAELTRSLLLIASSTEAARVQERPPVGIGFVDVFPKVGVGFVVASPACSRGSTLFFTDMTGSPLSSSGILRLCALLAGSWLRGMGAMMVGGKRISLFIDNRFYFVFIGGAVVNALR